MVKGAAPPLPHQFLCLWYWVLSFSLFTLVPLSQVISKFNVTHHLYADDTQIYLAVDSRNFDSSMEELTECLKSVQEWMDGVKLKLNPPQKKLIYHCRSKSHQRVACTKFLCPTPPKQYLSVGGSKESGCYIQLRQLL